MFLLYDIIFLLFAAVSLPVFLLKGKLHPGFGMRLGSLPKGLIFDRPLWIHAVSVGEAVSVRHLVDEFRRDFPGKHFVLSTVTPTGNKIAASIAGRGDFVTYLPLDFSPVVRSTLDTVNPAALIIVETEIWPNLIYRAAKKAIPIFVVNGRISDRSFKRYRLVKFLLAPLLNKITVFCVQSERDGRKLARLGLAPEKIKVTGNMKFDIQVTDYSELKKDYRDYRQSLGIGSTEKLWVAASTHQGEEESVLAAFSEARKDFPSLRLVIAPRHPERSAAVEAAVRAAGFVPSRVSAIVSRKDGGDRGDPRQKVFILDTVGKLMYFYAIADVVFVGGSIVKTGGHNILEPASLGKPVVFGPHMFNFRDIAALFLEHKAAVMAADAGELGAAVKLLLTDNAAASLMSVSARRIIADNRGATARNKEIIKSFLPSVPVLK